MSQPVVNDRASICHWNLDFYFLTKKQCFKFIKELEKLTIPINFSYWEDDVWKHNRHEKRYYVAIEDMCWTDNLVFIVKLLQKVDYKLDAP